MFQLASNRSGLTWCVALAALWSSVPLVHAQTALTDQDRTEIQALATNYARALGACAAEEYADLFAPDGGYFASGLRGELIGRDQLMALVKSERHCTNPPSASLGAPTSPAPAATAKPAAPAAPAGGGAARPAPTVTIEATATGARGRADLGNAGYYEDEYVKTAKGWRFKSRTVMTRQEVTAGLSVKDVWTIRRLAGSDLGQFDNVYTTDAAGGRRFRTAGLEILVSADGIKGKAYPKGSGGRYDDVYVRTADGGWRFQSRTFVAETPAK